MTARKRVRPSRSTSRRTDGDRAPVTLEVVFQSSGRAPCFGMLRDLSVGGACIESKKPSAVGEVITLHLPWPSREEMTSLTAIVRWVEPYRMGVQFSMAGPEALEAIARLGGDRAASLGLPPGTRDRAETAGFTRDEILAVAKAVRSMKRRVRFQEVDAAGTIYYSRIFEYFGDVYIDVLERDGMSVPKVMSQREWFSPLVHAEADYLAPMRFGDTVMVSAAKIRCGTSSATVGYRIIAADGRPLAVGHTVHVFVDGATFRPCRIPKAVRLALTGEEEKGA